MYTNPRQQPRRRSPGPPLQAHRLLLLPLQVKGAKVLSLSTCLVPESLFKTSAVEVTGAVMGRIPRANGAELRDVPLVEGHFGAKHMLSRHLK